MGQLALAIGRWRSVGQAGGRSGRLAVVGRSGGRSGGWGNKFLFDICENTSITFKFIEDNLDEINFNALSSNTFEKSPDNTLYYHMSYREESIAKNKIIKDELIEVAWHPDRMMDWCLDTDTFDDISKTFDI